jgi:DNA polymerase/3'-5' exonuclease PolX
MSNHDIAMVLFNIATLLDLTKGNPYRIRAYRRAARWLLRLRQEVADLIATGQEIPIPGLGKRLRAKIGGLARDGRLDFYAELVTDQHPAVQALMVVPGVGPKTALRLFNELDIRTPEGLVVAAQEGRVRQLWGFGARSEYLLGTAAAEVLAGGQRAAAMPAELQAA